MSVCITGQIGSGSHCSSYPPQILPEKTKKSRAPFLSRLVSYVYICTCVPQAIECGKSGFAILGSVGAFSPTAAARLALVCFPNVFISIEVCQQSPS